MENKLIDESTQKIYKAYKSGKVSVQDIAENAWYWLHKQLNAQALAASERSKENHEDVLVYVTMFVSHIESLRMIEAGVAD